MRKNIFIIALFISFFGAGFEHTFLNTLFPSIAYDLGGIEYFAWTALAFTLGNLLFLPIVGKLADTHDKKILFIGGNVLLILGAILSALSQNMFQMILFRFIMGIGAGTITTAQFIMIGLVFSVKERVKWQAIFGLVYTVSTFAGPVIAGYLDTYLTWRLIFVSPIIIFLFSTFGIIYGAKEYMKPIEGTRRNAVKFQNNFVLILIITIIALLISFSGSVIETNSSQFWVLMIILVLFSVLFYKMEVRSKEGVFPYRFFKEKLFVKSLITSIGAAMAKLIILTFAPMFIVLSLQVTTEKAGFVLTPLLVMAPISAYISGKLLLKIKYKYIVAINMLSITIGLYLFSQIGPNSPYLLAIVASIVTGVGAGAVSQILMIILQEEYDKKDIGVITSTFTFFRWFGNILGISLGTFLMTFYSKKTLDTSSDMDELYKQVYSGMANTKLIENWTYVFQQIFLISAVILLLTTLVSFTIGDGRLKERKNK